MSNLPTPVREAGLLFQQPGILNDHAAMTRIIRWGHEQIDLTYPEDPIRAPLNLVRRIRAHGEWEKVVRTAGRELRGAIMNSIVQQLQFEIQRAQVETLAQDAERRRREAVISDSAQRVHEYDVISDINFRNTEKERRLEHELSQLAEAAASERSKAEQLHKTEQAITLLVAETIAKTLGTNSAAKTIEATRLVNDEMARITNDPDLSNDVKHIQLKNLMETIPHLIIKLRAEDV